MYFGYNCNIVKSSAGKASACVGSNETCSLLRVLVPGCLHHCAILFLKQYVGVGNTCYRYIMVIQVWKLCLNTLMLEIQYTQASWAQADVIAKTMSGILSLATRWLVL